MTITTELEREPIDCRTAVQQLWDYLDHELDAVRMAEVTAHVERCAECAEHFAFARTFLRSLSASRSDVPDAVALRSRVVQALQGEGFSSDA
jgi:anti-sigma factor (TIGR02949 family)